MRIALGGKSRSGKDTTAAIFKKLNKKFELISFSSTVYKCMYAIQTVLNFEQKKEPALLQLLGEGLRSIYGEELFVNIVKSKVTDNMIITNVR